MEAGTLVCDLYGICTVPRFEFGFPWVCWQYLGVFQLHYGAGPHGLHPVGCYAEEVVMVCWVVCLSVISLWFVVWPCVVCGALSFCDRSCVLL